MNEGTPITGWSALADPPPSDERFWAELRSQLELVESDRHASGGRVIDIAAPHAPESRWAGRRRLVAAVAAVILVLAVVSVALLIDRDPDSIGPVPADESPEPTAPTSPPATTTPVPVDELLGLVDLADVLPVSTTRLSFVDVGAMRTFYGVDAADMADRIDAASPIPMDDVSNVEGSIRVAVPPFAQPIETAHARALDLGSIELIATVEMPETMTVIATSQDPEQLASGYEDGGFDPIGDGRLLHPEGSATGGASGGSPAVALAPGRVVLAPSAGNLDAFARDDVGDTALRTLLEAAAGARAGGLLVPDGELDDVGGCERPFALIASDAGYELLLLDGGTDSLDPDRLRGVFEALPVGLEEVGQGRVDGVLTRYTYVPDDSGDMPVLGSAEVTWTTIRPEAPPLTPCPS